MKHGFNGTREIIDIPGSGAAFQAILATGPVVYVKVVESLRTAAGAANVLQGFDYLIPNDGSAPGFSTDFSIPPNTVLELGDRMGDTSRFGSPIGNGPDAPGAGVPARAATTIFKARSSTATPTSIEITQYY